MREDLTKGKVAKEAMVVTASDLARMKASTKVETKEETMLARKI
jgi:hypothetical protein